MNQPKTSEVRAKLASETIDPSVLDTPGTHSLNGHGLHNQRTVTDANLDFTRLFYMLYISLDTQIAIADTKAQIIMGANAILIASIAFNAGGLSSALMGSGTLPERLSALLTLAVALVLIGSVFFALGSSRPNLRGSKRRNLFFFGHITQLDEDEFIDQFMNMNMKDIKVAVLGQIHARSTIVEAKYRGIRWSLIFLFAGLLLWMASRIVLAL